MKRIILDGQARSANLQRRMKTATTGIRAARKHFYLRVEKVCRDDLTELKKEYRRLKAQ